MPIATVNKIKINYQAHGQGDPMVMIMGFNSPASTWSSQVSFFKNYYKVITFDNRGVGKSEKPAGPYSTRMMADDTVALMDHLGIKKAHIVGASMGGMIAQELAINYPERILKLVLACTFSCNDETSGNTAEQAELAKLPPKKMPAAMAKLACNKPFFKLFVSTSAMIQTIFTQAAARIGIEGQIAACTNHNTLNRLASIKSPTLVIAGTKDKIINPTSSDVIAQAIRGAKLVKIEEGSHMLFMENKTEFNQKVLDFLK
jgi:pimeloyl-ACP methyl ester carboxylesterase